MLSRFLTKVLGSRRDGRSEAQRRDSRLESRLNELRLESLAEGRVPVTEPALLVPGTINGKGTLPDEQDSFDANVQADVAGRAARDSGTHSLSDANAGDESTAATITPPQIDQPAAPAPAQNSNGTGDYNFFTITGTATWSTGSDACSSFVASGLLPGADAISSPGGHSIIARYVGDADFTMATSQVLGEDLLPTVMIGGTGTLLNQQDTFTVNVEARALGDALTAATITSIQMDQAETSAPGGRTMGLCTCFEIAGTVTLDGGTSARYSFVVAIALPVLGAMNSTGFLTLQVGGPDDF